MPFALFEAFVAGEIGQLRVHEQTAPRRRIARFFRG